MQHLKDAYASSVQPAAVALLKAYPGLLEPHWFTWERFLWASELSYAYTMQVACCMFGPGFGSQFQSECEAADRDDYCNDHETLCMTIILVRFQEICPLLTMQKSFSCVLVCQAVFLRLHTEGIYSAVGEHPST